MRLKHVGMTVSSLERSLGFYVQAFGFEVIAEQSFSGPLYEEIMSLRGARGRAALIRREGLELELFEFSPAGGIEPTRERAVCERGLTHFCIEVEDIERVYRQAKASGARFHCAPLDFGGEARATYGRDPDGNIFELWENP